MLLVPALCVTSSRLISRSIHGQSASPGETEKFMKDRLPTGEGEDPLWGMADWIK